MKLFEDKSHFTTGVWARPAGGSPFNSVFAEDPTACAWCLEGGLQKCSPDFPSDAAYPSPIYDAVVSRLKPLMPKKYGTLWELNDTEGLASVRRLLRKGLKSFEKKAKA
jgi:hypothetical protein